MITQKNAEHISFSEFLSSFRKTLKHAFYERDNIALFLEPVAKYAQEAVKEDVFNRFLTQQIMGGLMITEPDYGSDALNMQTSNVRTGSHYHIQGTKHWQGLTGMADYWLSFS